MKRSVLVDRDHGWLNIKNEMAAMRGAVARIGLLSKSGKSKKSNASIVEIGFYNEFGTKDIPARPFIRTTADENRTKYVSLFKSEATKIFQGRSTTRRSLELIGLRAQADVRKKIKSIKTPPNAASTIRQKGSDNPLIDDGTMLRAVDFEVKGA